MKTIYRLYKAVIELDRRDWRTLADGVCYEQDTDPVAIKDFATVEEGIAALRKLESRVSAHGRLLQVEEYYLQQVDCDGDYEDFGDCLATTPMPVTISASYGDGETIWEGGPYADVNAAWLAIRDLPSEDEDGESILYAIRVCGRKVFE